MAERLLLSRIILIFPKTRKLEIKIVREAMLEIVQSRRLVWRRPLPSAGLDPVSRISSSLSESVSAASSLSSRIGVAEAAVVNTLR